MSSDTDAYWVGALAMTCARAQHHIISGNPEQAFKEITDALQHLAHSPVFDEGLKTELAQYWEPEKGADHDDNRDVLRPLRS
jgi:hypothetical protein